MGHFLCRHSVQSVILMGVLCVSVSALTPREQHTLLTLFRRMEQHPEFYDADLNNYDDNYSEMQREQEPNENFLSNWPWLRDLLPNPNDVNFAQSGSLRNHEVMPKSVLDPPEMSDKTQSEVLPTPLPYVATYGVRGNLQKKDAHSSNYMSLCHFKICNMGRKRNTRYFHL
ncbi:uncharacterized protein DMENIID0001_046260 [Sergentomyia squamirostris]